jgi:hypothetical protein
MGTRSLTDVIETFTNEKGETKNTTLLTMYRQFDGYPSGMGKELAEFLNLGKVVNGISSIETNRVFNGAGCLAAQLVSHFKGDSAGGFYIQAPKQRNCGEEFIYQVFVDYSTKQIKVRCYEVGYIDKKRKYVNKNRVLFYGELKDYIDWLEKLD